MPAFLRCSRILCLDLNVSLRQRSRPVARTVLVTGGGNGIGRAIAARFTAAGERVIITGRNEERLKQAAADIGARGVACDHTVPAQLTRLAGRIGPELDVLVNNAGGNTDFTGRGSTAAGSDVTAGASTAPETELEQVAAGWHANLHANLLSA